jgi:DNA-directed RNA polymerase beta subunit
MIKLLTNGMIVVRITNKRLQKYHIPFYVIFRALGVSSDKEIVDHIIYGWGQDNASYMMSYLKNAFTITGAANPDFSGAVGIYNQLEMLKYMNKVIEVDGQSQLDIVKALDTNQVNTTQFLVDQLQTLLDRSLFPHLGNTMESRPAKVRFLGLLIAKVLMVNRGVIPSTDRDSCEHKRFHSAGVAYAKAFKTQYNLAIVTASKKAFTRAFKNRDFSNVPLANTLQTSISGPELQSALIRSIVTGNKEVTIFRKQVQNRLSSQLLQYKNPINVISSLRQINTPNTSSSKQDQRSDEMRRVHPSQVGFECVIQSADTGIKVGIHKQMALTAIISKAGSSGLIKEQIIRFNDIIPLNKIDPIRLDQYAKVFVNGEWIGCVIDSNQCITKYRERRRNWEIYPYTTINIDRITNEVFFWVDIGRIMRPLLIVYRNPKTGIQDIALQPEHIERLLLKPTDPNVMTIEELMKLKIIEYISPEEQDNLLIANSLTTLRANKANQFIDYTHCDISISIMGVAALTSPYANHNQAPRITYQTNQVKQTYGWPAMNWPYCFVKDLYHQYYLQYPLVKTVTNGYIRANGNNCIVAILSHSGYNQEDSIIANQSALERGLFQASKRSFKKTEIEKGEEIQIPDRSRTIEIKASKNYEKLVDGIVPVGTIIEKNDVLIGKVVKLTKAEQTVQGLKEEFTHCDRSVVYEYNERAIVEAVTRGRNEDGNEFVRVTFSAVRTPTVGDKFSSRSGQLATGA